MNEVKMNWHEYRMCQKFSEEAGTSIDKYLNTYAEAVFPELKKDKELPVVVKVFHNVSNGIEVDATFNIERSK